MSFYCGASCVLIVARLLGKLVVLTRLCCLWPAVRTLTSLPCTRTRTHAAQPLVAQTDVWSWGVTAWEIASLGLRPYGDVADADVVKHVAATGKDASTRLPTARLDIAEVRAALSLRAFGLLFFCMASLLSCN